MILPKRTKSQKIGSKSEDAVSRVFTEFCNVIPIPQSKDIGIDFYCELIKGEFPTAKLFGIQCKGKEQVKNCKDYFSIQIELKTLNYWLILPFPVFLIVVDDTEQIFYWVYPKEQIEDLIELPDYKSIRIYKSNNFDKSLKTLPKEINSVVDDYYKKYSKYDSVNKELQKIKKINELLSENKNPAFGISKDYFVKIHKFLDVLNYFLDNKFKLVKRIFYDNCWKIGFAYHEFEYKKVVFTLYPISFKMNDIQIKEVDDKLKKKIKPYGLIGHFTENPIINNPKNFALDVIQSNMSQILQENLLSHKNNLFLVNEFIIAFIDKFHIQMGLQEKDEYTLSEMETGFNQYMPIWIEEALKIPHVTLGRMRYVDPDFLISQIMKDERQKIDTQVRKRLTENEYVKYPFILGNKKLLMRVFVESLEILKNEGITNIKRIYRKQDFNRLRKCKSHLKWNVYSVADLEENLKIFFKNLPTAFNDVINENFPLLKKEMDFFKKFNRILVVFDAKEKYENGESPIVKIYYLVDPDEKSDKIDIYKEGEKEIPKVIYSVFGGMLKLNGKMCKVIEWDTDANFHFIFDEIPLSNYIYHILEKRFEEYFKILKSNNRK